MLKSDLKIDWRKINVNEKMKSKTVFFVFYFKPSFVKFLTTTIGRLILSFQMSM